MIEFQKTVKKATILSPLKNFEEETLTFEYSADPLTGRNTTVIRGMLDYVNKFYTSDADMVKALVEKTRATCPFCPESVNLKTPMFPKDFLAEGRIIEGDAVVVPNLLGHAERSILAVLGSKHHLSLNEFPANLFVDGFKGGIRYLQRLNEIDDSVRFPIFAFNYLTSAGSSIFHPHMQILVRDRPFFLTELQLEKSRAYYEHSGGSFWRDLVEAERNGERWLGGVGNVYWLVPFAPIRGLNEAQAIVDGKSNLLELSDGDLRSLSEGIVNVLRFYHLQGYESFNIVIISGPVDKHVKGFEVNLRIINRPGIQQSCFTDAWALPLMLWDGEAVEEPERLAKKLKPFFCRD